MALLQTELRHKNPEATPFFIYDRPPWIIQAMRRAATDIAETQTLGRAAIGLGRFAKILVTVPKCIIATAF